MKDIPFLRKMLYGIVKRHTTYANLLYGVVKRIQEVSCNLDFAKSSFLNDFWKKTVYFRKNVVIKLVEGVLF